MPNHDLNSIHEDLGYIKGKVESIEAELIRQNGRMGTLEEKMSRVDIIFGKVGVIVVGLIFVVTTGLNFALDFIKGKLLK